MLDDSASSGVKRLTVLGLSWRDYHGGAILSYLLLIPLPVSFTAHRTPPANNLPTKSDTTSLQCGYFGLQASYPCGGEAKDDIKTGASPAGCLDRTVPYRPPFLVTPMSCFRNAPAASPRVR